MAANNTTLIHLFLDRVAESGNENAIWIKRDGAFQPLTWNQIGEQVRQMAAGLRKHDVRAGDRVVQIGENSLEWIVNDLAIQMARAIHVPIHAPLAGEQIVDQILDSGSTLVLVGDVQQYVKLMACETPLPRNVQVVASEQPPKLAESTAGVLSRRDLISSVTEDEISSAAEEAVQHAGPASLATILYTSGTTGTPKGVVLSQQNLVSNTLATVEAFGMQPTETRICFLPMSHIFARTCDLYTWIVRGSQIALVESLDTILPDCVRFRPTTINAVPYFFQRVHRYLTDQGKVDEPGVLKKTLGGNIQACCSGGAALPDYLYDYFEEQNVPILQGYGLTETSPVIATNAPGHRKRGTVGKPIPGVEVRIADDGEVLARGPNIMVGYWNNSEATKEILRDGWLHTGDLGSLDEEGFLSITGRKKDIIVTAGGKNVAPIRLERLLTADPMIIQAIVVGDNRNYLTALIVPDPDNIRKAVRKLRILPLSKRWVLDHRRVRAIYEEIIRKRLDCVSHHEQIRKFYLMDRGFTIESGEMTPKLSLKRDLIQHNCHEIIDEMYNPKPTANSWAQRIASMIGA